MVDRDLLNAFDNCIDSLATGNSIDECVRRYPQFASALRPMLEAGKLLPRAHFASAEIRLSQDRVRFRVVQAVNHRRLPSRSPLRRLMPLVASMMLVFILALGATSLLAESSLPGDTLYGMKRLTENVRLLFTINRDALEPQFNQRRISEIEQLVAQQREALVEFEGAVEAINPPEWLIAELRVQVVPETFLDTSIVIGNMVAVNVVTTQGGQIVATSIMRIDSEPILPTETPYPTTTDTPIPIITQTQPSLPISRPTSEAACVPTQPQGWLIYTVQPEDTLSDIAARTGAVLERLMRANCLTDRNLIITGQRLFVPILPATREPQETPAPRSTAIENRGANGSSDNSNGSEDGESGRGRGDG